MWSLEKRKGFVEEAFKNHPKVKVKTYEGLTAEFCKSENAGYILRGLRNSLDSLMKSPSLKPMPRLLESKVYL